MEDAISVEYLLSYLARGATDGVTTHMPLRTHTQATEEGREGEATGVKGSFRIRERGTEMEGGLFTELR